jgi:hypothetical protein
MNPDVEKTYMQILQARGLQHEAKKVEEKVQEEQLKTRIKQFYCSHVFLLTQTKIYNIQCKMHICNKCGLVK